MRVLIVEDDPLLSGQLAAALRDAGFVTDCAADGVQGEYLGATESYDVAVLDLGLPGQPLDQPHASNPAVLAAWKRVYQDPHHYWSLYELAEKLVDLDDALLTWRHKHVVTVERIIGRRQGTGGTDGVGYLVETLKRRCFPELWSLRTKL